MAEKVRTLWAVLYETPIGTHELYGVYPTQYEAVNNIDKCREDVDIDAKRVYIQKIEKNRRVKYV